ncbi:MAG: ATP-binding protein [Planctomycetales bacterium]|nr:ATP-binding protein [Planctomycetales bacterium]
MHNSNWNFSGAVASELERSREFVTDVINQLENRKWPDTDVFGIRMALEEAIVNAIKHGNQHDPVKSVHIDCEIRGDRFRIDIRDEGVGFDPKCVPDCTAVENLDKPSGRGVMLIKHYMTNVTYCENGTRVVMEKIRTEEAGE